MSEREDLIRELAGEVAAHTRVRAEPVQLADPTLGLGFNFDISSILKLILPILAPMLVPLIMPMISQWTGITYTQETIAFITTSLSGLITAILTGNIAARTVRVNNERNNRMREAELLQKSAAAAQDRELQRDILKFKDAQLTLEREKFAASQEPTVDMTGEPTGAAPRTKSA